MDLIPLQNMDDKYTRNVEIGMKNINLGSRNDAEEKRKIHEDELNQETTLLKLPSQVTKGNIFTYLHDIELENIHNCENAKIKASAFKSIHGARVLIAGGFANGKESNKAEIIKVYHNDIKAGKHEYTTQAPDILGDLMLIKEFNGRNKKLWI